MNVACNTTNTPATAAFLTATVADGWNVIDTIITLACSSRANSGYYNESRMILDGSYNTNAGRGGKDKPRKMKNAEVLTDVLYYADVETNTKYKKVDTEI